MEQSLPPEGAEEEEEVAPEAPLVFQCSGCRCIVGDSFSFVCADQNLGVVCLSGVTGYVTVLPNTILSPSGGDEGCVYKELTCKTCKNYKLGKIYTATPMKLGHMQQLYCLDTEAISSFVLGSVDQWTGSQVLERLPSVQHLRSVNGEVIKLQHVLVGLDERLQSLENSVQELKNQKTGVGNDVADSNGMDAKTAKRNWEQ